MTTIGLDVGDARIGVAMSEDGIFAHPLQTINRANLKDDLATLSVIISTYEADRVIVGLPKRLSGEIGIQGEKVQKFATALEKQIEAEVIFWDERFTTAEAKRILQQTVKNRKKKRKKIIDQIAAVLILEGYLTWRKNQNGLRESE